MENTVAGETSFLDYGSAKRAPAYNNKAVAVAGNLTWPPPEHCFMTAWRSGHLSAHALLVDSSERRSSKEAPGSRGNLLALDKGLCTSYGPWK